MAKATEPSVDFRKEILKQTDDESLFAHCRSWYSSDETDYYRRSLLAPSPDWFSGSGDIFPYAKLE